MFQKISTSVPSLALNTQLLAVDAFRGHQVIDLAARSRHEHKPDNGEVDHKETDAPRLGPQ